MLKSFGDWVASDDLEFVPVCSILLGMVCVVSFIYIPVSYLQYSIIEIFSRPWSLVTASFAHGSVGHLYGNVLFLILFGYHVEKEIGFTEFLRLFVFCGACAALGHSLFFPYTYLIGASGAVAGIMAVAPFCFKNKITRLVFLVGLCFFLYANILPLVTGQLSRTANTAHIFGAISGLYWWGVRRFS